MGIYNERPNFELPGSAVQPRQVGTMLRYSSPTVPFHLLEKTPRPDRRFNLHHHLPKQARMISIFFYRVSRSKKVDPFAHDFVEVTGGVELAIEDVANEEGAEGYSYFEEHALDVGADIGAVEHYRAFVILH